MKIREENRGEEILGIENTDKLIISIISIQDFWGEKLIC